MAMRVLSLSKAGTVVLAGLGLLVVGCASGPTSGAAPSSPSQVPAQQSAPTPTPNPLVLAPATTPSSVGVCTQQMSFGADGNATPILCSDGAVNTLAWTYFDQMYPDIFALGAYATEAQVGQAVSQMVPPLPDEESAYCLAKAYYDWSFAIPMDPVAQVLPGASCATDVPNFP